MANHYARELRSNVTEAEWVLWTQLKVLRRRDGFHFRRQAPIGAYIVDFACHGAKLIVELDGGQHNEPDAIRYDEMRTRWLEGRGYTVLRFWNNEVLGNMEGVMTMISESLVGLTPTPTPPRKGEGR